MASPTRYQRDKDFSEETGATTDNADINTEFDAVQQTLDDIIDNLAKIQRDDGELLNRKVGWDQLAESVVLSMGGAETWAADTNYTKNKTAIYGNAWYRATDTHTSGSTFAGDLAAHWDLLIDFAAWATAASASAAAASTSESNAAASASSAATSATSASASATTANLAVGVAVRTETASAGQTAFTAPTYTPGTEMLLVFINGALSRAYTETSSTTITFTSAMAGGEKVVILRSKRLTTAAAESTNVSHESGSVDEYLSKDIPVPVYGSDGNAIQSAVSAAAVASRRFPVRVPMGAYGKSSPIWVQNNDITIVGQEGMSLQLANLYSTIDGQSVIRAVSADGTTGIVRFRMENLLFNAMLDGNLTGAGTINSAPLVSDEGTSNTSYWHFINCYFERGTGFETSGKPIYSHHVRCKYNFTTINYDLFANLVFEDGDFETSTLNIGQETTNGGRHMAAFRGGHSEGSTFNLKGDSVSMSEMFLTNTTIDVGKSCANFYYDQNAEVYNVYLNVAPRFDFRCVRSYATNFVNTETRTPFELPSLRQESQVSSDYVSGDGLEYFAATSLRLKDGSAEAITVSFKVDAAAVSTDDMTITRGDDVAEGGPHSTNLTYVTYGVMRNSGSAISVANDGTSNVLAYTAYIQNLVKGTFPSGSTTDWYGPSVTTSHDGTYLRIQGSGGNPFTWNRRIVVPNTNVLACLARVKAGSTGDFGQQVWDTASTAGFSGVLENYFDNGDGTFDNLWVYYIKVSPGDVFVPAVLGFGKIGGAAFDVYVKWCAIIPVGATSEGARYTITKTIDPASIAAGGNATFTVATSGSAPDLMVANVGDSVIVHPPYNLQGVTANAYVSATGIVTMRLDNFTAVAVDLPSSVWKFEVVKQ